MNMGPGGFRGPWDMYDKLKPQKPKTLREVFPYLKEVVGGFFYRMFYIAKLVWEARPVLLFVMAFMAIFNGVMPVIGAYITKELLNTLAGLFMGARDLTTKELLLTILNPLLWQFGYIFFNSLVNHVSNMITNISGEVVTNHVKLKIMNKAKEIDVARFDIPEFYEKLENANREAGMRPINIMRSTFSMVSSVISLVSFIVILISISWIAPVTVILLSIPSALITFIYRKKNFLYLRFRSKERRQMNYYSDLLVNKDLVKEVRLFGLSDGFIDKYKKVFKKYFGGLRKLILHEGYWNIGISFVTTVINCVLFCFIAYSIYATGRQIGDYSYYTGALNSISGCVATLIGLVSSIYEGSLFIDNLIIFMEEKKNIVPILPQAVKPERHVGHTIRLENVSFRYPGTARDVIKHINLTIEPGDTLVMVGLNGAGKTTLIKLLTRLYDPTEGTIYLDGRDIREYDVDELYKIYGIIFQDFGKYAFNVKENIAFGQADIPLDEARIIESAQASNADTFIQKLPDGYDTPLMRMFEAGGIELSIGQWQKLSIARAFYSDSDILILDEPTASLDAIAEQEVFNQFDKLRKEKTTIFVSHRLSSATVANKIIVLKDGELIESGNHAELMKKRGHYFDLFSTQAKRYITTANEDINDGNISDDTYGERPPMPGARPPFPQGRPPFPPKN